MSAAAVETWQSVLYRQMLQGEQEKKEEAGRKGSKGEESVGQKEQRSGEMGWDKRGRGRGRGGGKKGTEEGEEGVGGRKRGGEGRGNSRIYLYGLKPQVVGESL